jgi:predicted metal-dependent hydrolase
MYPKEYVEFLAYFHGNRDYFECHEILEDYWKNVEPSNKDSVWVGLIQLAVSSYHHRRANFNGAKRTLEKAAKIFSLNEGSLVDLGLDKQSFFLLLKERLSAIQKEIGYTSFDLPISDPLLVAKCIETSKKKGFTWGNKSDMTKLSIIHKHKMRDRTYVIQERNLALKNRKGNE